MSTKYDGPYTEVRESLLLWEEPEMVIHSGYGFGGLVLKEGETRGLMELTRFGPLRVANDYGDRVRSQIPERITVVVGPGGWIESATLHGQAIGGSWLLARTWYADSDHE